VPAHRHRSEHLGDRRAHGEGVELAAGEGHQDLWRPIRHPKRSHRLADRGERIGVLSVTDAHGDLHAARQTCRIGFIAAKLSLAPRHSRKRLEYGQSV
jgi:hypothetical protein